MEELLHTPTKIRADWFKIVFLWLDRNTELEPAVEVIVVREKKISILMIEVHNLFSFVLNGIF